MPDQADILRHLVAGALRATAAPHVDSPPLVAIAGAKGGVGVTTLALNVAVTLSEQGHRVALVDVDFCRADVALYCGLTAASTTCDVLSGQRDIHEIFVAGPGGIQVAAGAWASPTAHQARPAAQHRLIDQLRRLGEHVDIVLLDLGCDASETAQSYWQAADRVLLVSTADTVAVMDAYATIKVAGAPCVDPQIDIVFNQLSSDQDAGELHRRIDHSCQRFLGFGVGDAGSVPKDTQAPSALRKRTPLTVHAPQSPASVALEQLAGRLSEAVGLTSASLTRVSDAPTTR